MGHQQAALLPFLAASPISFCPVRAHRRLGACCESLGVKAERPVPAYALVRGCSPASALRTQQRKAAGEKMRWYPGPGSPRTGAAARAAGAGAHGGAPGRPQGSRRCPWTTGHQGAAGPAAPPGTLSAPWMGSTCARAVPAVNRRLQRLCRGR